MLHSHNYFRWREPQREGADREGDGDGNEALFINLLCKQHHIRRSDRTCSVVKGGRRGRAGRRRAANSGARRVSSPFNHDRF